MSDGGSSRPTRAAIVDRIFDHNADTRSLFLNPVDGKSVRFVPGQFISILIPLSDETRTRAYTVASPVDQRPFEICFNRVPNGRGAEWLFACNSGDRLDFTGPYGAFTMEPIPTVETILIAEGTAIAPIRPMLHRALSGTHPKMTLLYAAHSEDHILYGTEFESFATRDPNFSFEVRLAPQSETYDRLSSETQRRWIDSDSNRSRQFYICGIGKRVITLRDLLRNAGYERRAVKYEQW